MAFTDYYKVLEVKRSATIDEIRTAYRKLAKQYHGDFSKSEEDKTASQNIMVDLNEAWEVFKDPEKWEKYNQEYDKHFPPPPPKQPPGASPNPPPQPPPGWAYRQSYAPPNPPPQPPPGWAYRQSYAPPMAPAAEAKQKRKKRMLLLGGIGGGAIGGAVAIGIFAAEHAAFGGGVILRLIAGAIVGAILGAIAGAIVGAISLVVIRKLAGKEALAFFGGKETGIVTIAGIVAGAIILVTPLAGQFALLAQFAVAVVVGLIAGALVARSVGKKY